MGTNYYKGDYITLIGNFTKGEVIQQVIPSITALVIM